MYPRFELVGYPHARSFQSPEVGNASPPPAPRHSGKAYIKRFGRDSIVLSKARRRPASKAHLEKERQLESQIKTQTPNKYMKNLKKGGKEK